MKPTEHEATVAVDAAARKAYDDATPEGDWAWDDLDPMTQNEIRNAVLPLVWAALEALPDRGAAERERIAAETEGLP